MPTNHYPHSGHHTDDKQQHVEPVLKPAIPAVQADDRSQSVNLIRQKLAAIYGNEPDASQELAEAQLSGLHHSKHQQYMLSLQNSGRSISQIQTDWHTYYQSLNDAEKRQVWQEFYSQSAQAKAAPSRIEPTYHYQEATGVGIPQPNHQQPTSQAYQAASQTALAQSAPAHAIYPTPTSGPVAMTTPLGYPGPGRGPGQPTQPEPMSQPGSLQAIAQPPHEQPQQPPQTANLISSNPLAAHHIDYEDQRQNQPQNQPRTEPEPDKRPPETIRQNIKNTVNDRRKLQAKHHLKSLVFGLSFGFLTLLIVMFSFFNQIVIAPFIQPSRTVSATPIIVSPGSVIASNKNEVIIPKINVQIPLDFAAKTTDTAEFEAALDRGVAHYPTTALPGEKGNASFFGHSSNNIFNPGKYKFAFVLLNELVPGDTFYINYNGVSYAYQVYDKKVVEATAVDILNPVADKAATAMLVTCDPPGTSLRRLAVWGEQVSPNPTSNTTPAASSTTSKATEALPGNGESLWSRLWNWASGN